MTFWEALGRYVAWAAFWMILTIAVAVVGGDGWERWASAAFNYANGMLVCRYLLLRERLNRAGPA